jgi:hypothetical protein
MAAHNPPDPETLPHWDLSNVFDGLESAAFGQAVGELKSALDAMDAFLDQQEIRRGGAVRLYRQLQYQRQAD